MKHRTLRSLSCLALLLSASSAAAQADIDLALPDMLLLVDSSGSMEYKSSSEEFPACYPEGDQASERSRWVELVEVLTGSITNYRCAAVDRSSDAFQSEYGLGTTPPTPDFEYKNPYHRPLSGTCAAGPGQLPTGAFDAAPISFHEYDNKDTSCSTFQQAGDGVLDVYRSTIRFGLMTFDTLTNQGVGYSGTTPDLDDGVDGAWSYFLSGNGPASGHPANCEPADYNRPYEVGARNTAAPPWEGRMITFGNPAASNADIEAKNEAIRDVLLTTRPFGATPIAGVMYDARDYLWNDTNSSNALDFAPRNDPYVTEGCRERKIILLTDGEPNLDLRDACAESGTPDGVCPYPQEPEDVALDLATASPGYKRVKTSVIAFASPHFNVGDGDEECSDLTDADLTQAGGKCLSFPGNKALQVCCRLNQIAFNGGTERAWFADNKEELRQAIIGAVSQSAPLSSRTQPAVAPGNGAGDAFAASYRFHSSFEPKTLDVWSGVLERQRFKCVDGLPEAQAIDPNQGDDFVANVNDPSQAKGRVMYTMIAEADGSSLIHSDRSVRPELSSSDGAGLVGGTWKGGVAENFAGLVPPSAMSIDNTTCASLSATACRDKYMIWDIGLDNGTEYQRCPSSGASPCNLIGGIVHSTPTVVGRPLEFVRDESYDAFKAEQAARPLVLYTSTTDGFLHAFKVAPSPAEEDGQAVNTKANNELWSFIPPAVLPNVPSQYPGTHQVLLDGVAVVKDVVAQVSGSTYVLERDADTVKKGAGTWRTILVQSFGGTHPGYFAMDITSPVPGNSSGPRFLWQLTKDSAGNPIVGERGATPLITTLFFRHGDEEKEIAVAVLPGGYGGTATGDKCDRAVDPNTTLDRFASGYAPRAQVNCYEPAKVAARSLTVVRLDTGEIIRTFRRDDDEVPVAWRNKVNVAPLDSPITGQPVAFPSQTGAVADRIFVGDQDGTLWKADVSSTNPADWTMELFFDAFTGQDALEGQPIATPPILSIKSDNNITVAAATGDQEVLSASDIKNYVWSLTDELQSNAVDFKTQVNWYVPFTAGERVTGPISLFNEQVFFATYKPQSDSTKVCQTGTGRVWGMHYFEPKEPGDLSEGGLPRLDNGSGLVQFLTAAQIVGGSGQDVVIFGVTVAQQPSCSAAESTTDDPYLGYGSHSSMTGITPGDFELIMHTGKTGSPVSGGKTKTASVPLQAPPTAAKIDSWAAIVE